MDADQAEAASKMAAAQRGKKARQDAKEQKDAASKVAAVQRGKNARKQKESGTGCGTVCCSSWTSSAPLPAPCKRTRPPSSGTACC